MYWLFIFIFQNCSGRGRTWI